MNTFKRWRLSSYLTQDQAAERAQVHRRTICQWEAAERLPENARAFLEHQGWRDNGHTSGVDDSTRSHETWQRPRGYRRARRGASPT